MASLVDETEKTEFNLYPVPDELEPFLEQHTATGGASFKQNIINSAFNKRPKVITDKIQYPLNASYGFCIKLIDFLNFVQKHESSEIINTYFTPINLQIPNIPFISNQIVTYLKDGSSRLFPGTYNRPSIPISFIQTELYIFNHLPKYITEIPPIIYYYQYFLDPNFNPNFQQTPNQIKQPELKLMQYNLSIRPTLDELYRQINPNFHPSRSQTILNNLTTTSQGHTTHAVDIVDEFKTLISKEQLKILIDKSRKLDDTILELTSLKEGNKLLEDRIKYLENQLDNKTDLINNSIDTLYTTHLTKIEELNRTIESLNNKVLNLSIENAELKTNQIHQINQLNQNNQIVESSRDLQGFSTIVATHKIEQEKQINSQLSKINELTSINKIKDEEINKIKQENKELQQKIEILNNTNSTLTTELNTFTLVIKNKDKIIEDKDKAYLALQETLNSILDSNNKLTSEITNKNFEIQKLTIKINQMSVDNIISQGKHNQLINEIVTKYIKLRYEKDVTLIAVMFEYDNKVYFNKIDNRLFEVTDKGSIKSIEITSI